MSSLILASIISLFFVFGGMTIGFGVAFCSTKSMQKNHNMKMEIYKSDFEDMQKNFKEGFRIAANRNERIENNVNLSLSSVKSEIGRVSLESVKKFKPEVKLLKQKISCLEKKYKTISALEQKNINITKKIKFDQKLLGG